MEHIITRRRGFRKLLAFCFVGKHFGASSGSGFAMSVGQTASSWLGDQYVGSDGEPLPRPGALHLSCLPYRRNHRRTHQFQGAMLTGIIC